MKSTQFLMSNEDIFSSFHADCFSNAIYSLGISAQVLVQDAFYNTGGDCGAYQTHLLGVPRRLSWSHRRDLCPPAPLTRLPAPAACHPSSGLLRPFAEVLTQETDLLLPPPPPVMMRVRMWGRNGTLGLDATGDWIEGEFPPLSG